MKHSALTYDEAKRRAVEAIRREEERLAQYPRPKPIEEHTCNYYCNRPQCIRSQRDELRDKYYNLIATL